MHLSVGAITHLCFSGLLISQQRPHGYMLGAAVALTNCTVLKLDCRLGLLEAKEWCVILAA